MENSSRIIENLRLNIAELVDYAGNGHPGMGMSSAGLGLALWDILIKDTENPDWGLRDRVIFSGGQGIVLQYMLHYFEGSISKEELLTFRKKNSRLPGLSEYRSYPTVESTTGSLGQGIANSVGMAIGLKHIKNNISKVYCVLGEGCLEEGISYESMSLAGTLQLDNLVVLYDSNKTSIDGKTEETFRDNMKSRFESIHWDYEHVENGDDVNEILNILRSNRTKPLFIEVSSKIAKGSLLEGNPVTHGKPLGREVTEKMPGYDKNQFLQIFPETRKYFKHHNQKLKEEVLFRNKLFSVEVENKQMDAPLVVPEKGENNKNLTLIEQSSRIMNEFAGINNFLVGSADLSRSTKVKIHDSENLSKENYLGRNIVFGIREHAMSSIATGIYLSTGIKVAVSTYLSFSDLMKNSIRMASIMKIPNIYVFTHDGISLAQDGTTHIPIEQISALRSMPNLNVIRPASSEELYLTWFEALSSTSNPTVIILSREVCDFKTHNKDILLRGYRVNEIDFDNSKLCIVSSGSDVTRALKVSAICKKYDVNIPVFSIANLGDFLEKNGKFFLNKNIIIIEMSNDSLWYKISASNKRVIQINKYIHPGTHEEIEKDLEFQPEQIATKILKGLQDETLFVD